MIVMTFMERNITYATDRLPALSAIAKNVATQTGFTYLAGLWKEDLLRGLTWTAYGADRTGNIEAHKSPSLTPSWSWAAQQRRIVYPAFKYPTINAYQDEPWEERDDSMLYALISPVPSTKAQISGYGCNPIDVDTFGRQNGGYLRMTAHMCQAVDLHRRVEARDNECSWKVFWDRSGLPDPPNEASLRGLRVLGLWRMLQSGLHPRTVKETYHDMSKVDSMHVVIGLLLEPSAFTSEYRRVGLVEIFEKGRGYGMIWQSTTMTIV